MKKIITRFAPSPTGLIHVGNIRSFLSLYYFLLLKKNYYFYLRIDDTNYYKYKLFYLKYLINIIFYFKVYYNNIIFQSNKFYRYIEISQYLINKKKSFISYENFKFNKFKKILKKLNFKLNINIKNIKIKKINIKNKFIKNKFIIKVFYKKINILNKNKNNFLIIKSNGIPIYNYSSVLDDIDNNINLIFRGIDHFNNLYVQILFYLIFKKNIPKIFHKEILLNNLGNKISKSINNYNFLKLKIKYFLESIILYIFNFNNFFSLKKIIFLINKKKNNFFIKLNNFNLNLINKINIKILNLFYIKNKIKYYILFKFFLKKKIFYNFNLNFFLNTFFKKVFSKINDFKYIIIFNKNNFININFIKKINKKFIRNFLLFFLKKKGIIINNNLFFFLKLYLINRKNFPIIYLFLKNFKKNYFLKKIKINFFNIKYIVPFV
ncbi:Glutamate--tRNA ligase [Candidatus Nasuia deltocephalinicola]|nr:Glutamate--tRNA ligase [Candidatus Nasuia deltocephalinicola]